MYTKSDKIITKKEDISNYVEGIDIYNSKLLMLLQNTNLKRKIYEITASSYRPDLIAKDVYGSTSYMGFVILQASMGLENFKIGTRFPLIIKSEIDRIIQSL